MSVEEAAHQAVTHLRTSEGGKEIILDEIHDAETRSAIEVLIAEIDPCYSPHTFRSILPGPTIRMESIDARREQLKTNYSAEIE